MLDAIEKTIHPWFILYQWSAQVDLLQRVVQVWFSCQFPYCWIARAWYKKILKIDVATIRLFVSLTGNKALEWHNPITHRVDECNGNQRFVCGRQLRWNQIAAYRRFQIRGRNASGRVSQKCVRRPHAETHHRLLIYGLLPKCRLLWASLNIDLAAVIIGHGCYVYDQ